MGRKEQTPKRRKAGSKEGGKARRASVGKMQGSISGWVEAKASQKDLYRLGFTPSLAKPEIRKKVGG